MGQRERDASAVIIPSAVLSHMKRISPNIYSKIKDAELMTWQYQSTYDVTRRAVTSTVTQEKKTKSNKNQNPYHARRWSNLHGTSRSEYVRAQPIVKEQ